MEVLAKICNVLGCTMDDIMEVLPDEAPETEELSGQTGDDA